MINNKDTIVKGYFSLNGKELTGVEGSLYLTQEEFDNFLNLTGVQQQQYMRENGIIDYHAYNHIEIEVPEDEVGSILAMSPEELSHYIQDEMGIATHHIDWDNPMLEWVATWVGEIEGDACYWYELEQIDDELIEQDNLNQNNNPLLNIDGGQMDAWLTTLSYQAKQNINEENE